MKQELHQLTTASRIRSSSFGLYVNCIWCSLNHCSISCATVHQSPLHCIIRCATVSKCAGISYSHTHNKNEVMEWCIIKRKLKRIHSYIARGSSEGPGVGAPECSSLRFQASALKQTGQRVPAVYKLWSGWQTWWLGLGSQVMVLQFSCTLRTILCSWLVLVLVSCVENGHSMIWLLQSCSILWTCCAASLFRSSLSNHSNLNCSDSCLINPFYISTSWSYLYLGRWTIGHAS